MKKQIQKQTQKGFSLVELMVVIAIIAILAAVAIPMYSNYTTRAKVGAELAKLGGAKADIADQIAGEGLVSGSTGVANDGALSGQSFTADVPKGVTIDDKTGVLTISATEGADLPSGSSLTLTPLLRDNTIEWECEGVDLSKSQLPGECKPSLT